MEVDLAKDGARGARRHQEERLKKARSAYDGAKWQGADAGRNTAVAVGKTCQTPAACSCFMCGNPRKYFGKKTLKEKSDDAFVGSMDVRD